MAASAIDSTTTPCPRLWLAVALPFKHELSVVEFSYPLTWITATVLFAIYYTKGGWMQRCIAAQNAKTQG